MLRATVNVFHMVMMGMHLYGRRGLKLAKLYEPFEPGISADSLVSAFYSFESLSRASSTVEKVLFLGFREPEEAPGRWCPRPAFLHLEPGEGET